MKTIGQVRTQREIQEIIEYCFARGVQYIRFESGLEIDWTPPKASASEPATKLAEAQRTQRNEQTIERCEKCDDKKVEGKFGLYCFNCWSQTKARGR